ncbi:Nuclear transport receptor LGL2 (importin beta superfamily) [Phaffia rhodozyma]|uniref:Nuclear transport receptor LGL2 (Importin beta superfamily) n=1 Tax=Phaffia rhodozyma TaxID=264483 RepID=A0A0F7SU68_PHARH|nr:Nuclear transport receptor LGL2 (importin beta superfamily) [Phaffia rhodozyma]
MISQQDIDQVIHLVQLSYSPISTLAPAEQQQIQHQLVQAQKSEASWGLIEPLISHQDVTVRFFGAHTASVKITRDWDTLPEDQQLALLSSVLEWTAQTAFQQGNGIVVRKLFVALSSLVLRLTPHHFPNPLSTLLRILAPPPSSDYALPLEFFQILIEEVTRTGLIGQRKIDVYQVLNEEDGIVIGAVGSVLAKWVPGGEGKDEGEMELALKCLESWIGWGLSGEHLNPLLPILIQLLDRPETLIPASTCMQEVLCNSILKDGRGSKVLTEPLLAWVAGTGRNISENLFQSGDADETAGSVCKLLVALGEHSADYLALHLIRPEVQIFFSLMLGFSGFEGSYGVDEEVSEIPLGFWSLFQESITASPHIETADSDSPATEWTIAKQIFAELFQKLRLKCMLPSGGGGWMKDQVDKFRSYRFECGDAMVTSYYILRSDSLSFILSCLLESLNAPSGPNWEEIEVSLHCLRCVQETVPVEEDQHLPRIFSQDLIGKLPMEGDHRVRATAIALIGDYSSWFHSHPANVLTAVSYIVPALEVPALSASAAKSLKRLCDLCRASLTNHIGAFGELYAKVEQRIEPEEKARVLEAITSVVQALPPMEAINPIKNITEPVVNTIVQALEGAAQLPEEAKAETIQRILSLTAIAKGLTPSDDFDFDLEEEDEIKVAAIAQARSAPELVELRERLLRITARVIEIWSTDSEVADSLSSFLKAMTTSLSSPTLLSLDAEPLIRLIAGAAQRNINGIWLSLGESLIGRLLPPPGLDPSAGGYNQAAMEVLVRDVAGVMVRAGLDVLRDGLDAMVRHPDIVESLFKFVGCVAARFPGSILGNPTDMVDLMMGLSVDGLGLQERYSLQAVTGFVTTAISRSRAQAHLLDEFNPVLQKYGHAFIHAIILGAGGRSPRSMILHLAELLAAMVTRFPELSAGWLGSVLAVEGFPDRRATPKAKEKLKATVLKSRTTKRVREALNEFALVARGLENSAYGNAAPL